jgi:hypothetical protein
LELLERLERVPLFEPLKGLEEMSYRSPCAGFL